ncbi:MAG: hypothetical protein IPG22_13955 [Acidobacteria bacterium]|nr:hypothetical protein [Acidobacteriota bacterium]
MNSITDNPNPDVTMLQKTTGNRGGNNAKTIATRKIFIEAYEEHFGNVTAACSIAGISRQTYYRWMKSLSRTNVKFRERLRLTNPKERYLDFLESAQVKRVLEGSDAMIKLGLERKGQSRGWAGERPKEEQEKIDQIGEAYLGWVAIHPDGTLKDKRRWLGIFAEKAGVSAEELGEKVGLPLARTTEFGR